MSTVSVEPGVYRAEPPRRPGEVIDLIRKRAVQVVDLRFTDLPGLWQHFSITLPEVNDELFDAGIGFDGSSIRGFQEIHESDMLYCRTTGRSSAFPGRQHETARFMREKYDYPLANSMRTPRRVSDWTK
ncbi:Glutamine synthetase [Ralstonia syzygii subsp. syzygii]|nr:Glutamine synthetase [Ralstonia syzygii subsp. syzygii]